MSKKEKLYDLTLPWGHGVWQWPCFDDTIITSTHRHSRHGIRNLNVYTNMHTGTHIDAPVHFVPSGLDIASVPLERLYGEGVIVDISDVVGEFDIVKPEHITSKMEVKKGDILVYHTGWHNYSYAGKKPDEKQYFGRLPGCYIEFAEWAVEMELKWVGFDTPCFEHALNTFMRDYHPDLVKECEEKIGMKYDDFIPREHMNIVQKITLPKNVLHVECMGGEIDKVLNKRCRIGAFPWRFVGGDASICRVVAFVEEVE